MDLLKNCKTELPGRFFVIFWRGGKVDIALMKVISNHGLPTSIHTYPNLETNERFCPFKKNSGFLKISFLVKKPIFKGYVLLVSRRCIFGWHFFWGGKTCPQGVRSRRKETTAVGELAGGFVGPKFPS